MCQLPQDFKWETLICYGTRVPFKTMALISFKEQGDSTSFLLTSPKPVKRGLRWRGEACTVTGNTECFFLIYDVEGSDALCSICEKLKMVVSCCCFCSWLQPTSAWKTSFWAYGFVGLGCSLFPAFLCSAGSISN